jgi:hypothetical protein
MWKAPNEPVYGHIGWTLDQCRQYYGQETGIVMGAYEFANAGGAFSIYVRFLEGKVAFVSYRHKDPSKFSFTKQEIDKLLFENANGYVWTRVGSNTKEVDYSAHLDGRVAMQAWYAKGAVAIATSEFLSKEGQ